MRTDRKKAPLGAKVLWLRKARHSEAAQQPWESVPKGNDGLPRRCAPRNDIRILRLAAGLFGFLAAFGGIGCIVTGLRFDGISMVTVAVVCALSAAVFALGADHKRFPILPGVLLLIGLWLWWKGPLARSLEALLLQISRLYDSGYGWGVIRWSNTPVTPDMAQLSLCALGVLIVLGVCWSFLKSRSIWPAVIVTCLPVVPCMILTDTVPAAGYLYMPLLCLVLLLLIRLAKKRGQEAPLLKLLTLPTAVAVLLLFLCMPQTDSSNIKIADTLIAYVQELFSGSAQKQPVAPAQKESSWVNLTNIGPKGQRRSKVMEVTAQRTEYLYLRGFAYDTYYGTWWDSRGTAVAQPGTAPTSNYAVTVSTTALHDVLYLPYRAYGISSGSNSIPLEEANGCVENSVPWRSYIVLYKQLPGYGESWEAPAQGIPDQYLQLPADTQRAARNYLKQKLPELETMTGVWSKANTIVDHVSQSAVYDLRTQKMPADGTDFAMWFLEESNSGYCVHFATAATVLLRAAGIPCRYVTGYLVAAQANRTVTVLQDNSHAWVECYIAGVGWVPLEPTPADGISQTVSTGSTESPETTAAAETTDPAPAETTEAATTAPTLPPVNPSEGTGTIGGTDGPGTVIGTDTPQDIPREFPGWLKWVLGVLAAAAVITGQWRLRVWLRIQKRSRGGRKAQVLARWQEVSLHARVRGEEPDKRLLELAQRAKFSHHAVTREELKEFDSWLVSSKQTIAGFRQTLLATLIYALY